jgi:hypothetical protein
LRKASARKVRKADDHKYIRREGSPGNYTYYYTGDGNSADKPAQDKDDSDKPPEKGEVAEDKRELPVIEKVSTRTDVNSQNYGVIAKQEFLKLDKRIKQGLVCNALQGRRLAGTLKKHLKSKGGRKRLLEDQIRRVGLMPFIIPVIEKGMLDDTQVKKGQNYYEIAARAETGAKVSVILVENTKTRLLYLSVFDDNTNVNKSLSQVGRPATVILRRSYPSRSWGQRFVSLAYDTIIPEITKESSGEIKKTREAVLKSLLRTLRIWKRKRKDSGSGRLERKAGA